MVPRLWPESTIVCIGSGPSLLAADLQMGRDSGARLLAVNSSYHMCPSGLPDALFAADAKWWGWHADAIKISALKFAFPPTSLKGVETLEWSKGVGLDPDPARLRSGGHSGYAAINLAVHLGARRIVLVGYDLCPAPDGSHHAHIPHPDGSHLRYEYQRAVYQTLLKPLSELGISLVNASRRTAIPDIPRVSLEQALSQEMMSLC